MVRDVDFGEKLRLFSPSEVYEESKNSSKLVEGVHRLWSKELYPHSTVQDTKSKLARDEVFTEQHGYETHAAVLVGGADIVAVTGMRVYETPFHEKRWIHPDQQYITLEDTSYQETTFAVIFPGVQRVHERAALAVDPERRGEGLGKRITQLYDEMYLPEDELVVRGLAGYCTHQDEGGLSHEIFQRYIQKIRNGQGLEEKEEDIFRAIHPTISGPIAFTLKEMGWVPFGVWTEEHYIGFTRNTFSEQEFPAHVKHNKESGYAPLQ